MGVFTRGDVVVVPLDFSDFSNFKRRPALVVATPTGLDPVLCMITSRIRQDTYNVMITNNDFEYGGLRVNSYVRVCHLFTVDGNFIEYIAGRIIPEKINEVIDAIIAMLR